jgi:hypothetical protein
MKVRGSCQVKQPCPEFAHAAANRVSRALELGAAQRGRAPFRVTNQACANNAKTTKESQYISGYISWHVCEIGGKNKAQSLQAAPSESLTLCCAENPASEGQRRDYGVTGAGVNPASEQNRTKPLTTSLKVVGWPGLEPGTNGLKGQRAKQHSVSVNSTWKAYAKIGCQTG